jgi:hypothetical protein
MSLQLSSAFPPPTQRPPLPIVILGGGLDYCRVCADLTAELIIQGDDTGGIRASLAGDLAAEAALESDRRRPSGPAPELAGWTPARITTSRNSSLPLGQANPFAWLQLMDQVGKPFTEPVLLGHGVHTRYPLHARFEAEALRHRSIARGAPIAGRPPVPHEARVAIALRRGLYARLVLRTYASVTGPRFQTEALVLDLMAPHEPTASAPALSRGFPRPFSG